MVRVIVFLTSTSLFTIFGMVAAGIVLYNRAADFHDRDGMMTFAIVIGPTLGGLIIGAVLGGLCSAMLGSKSS